MAVALMSVAMSSVAVIPAALTSRRRPILAVWLALCGPLITTTSVLAMGAAAPFTPPPRVAAPTAAAASAPASAATLDPTTPALVNSAVATESGLSGMHLGSPPRALIDGEWVAVGDTVRGARLQALHADEAQLRHPDGRLERLRMAPLVELQVQPRPPPLSTASRRGAAHPAKSPESP